ncbi:MAG: type IV secretion system DNA-binding domain-containing protein, partial [Smithella sp.]|nr:type IV secretion system DNA-binding domain-containing protein [Smithella sp.]
MDPKVKAKIIFAVVLWVIVVLVKFGRVVELFDDLKTAKGKKWKAVLTFVSKSPWFSFVVFSFFMLLFFDRTTRFVDLCLTIPFSYLLPVAGYAILKKLGGPAGGGKEHVRGSSVSEETVLARALAKCTDDACLPVTAKIRIPAHYETTHFFTIGRPGCGKSQLFYRVIQKVIDRKDKAIIYDFKGDLVAKFYNPDRDILFNPFDKRCVNWNIFNEIESQLDIRSIANSLIPITGNDPYWSNAARDVFAGILTACFMAGRRSNEEVFQCCTMPAHDLAAFLSKYKGTETAIRHLAQDKASQSILSVMGSSTQCFEYLRNVNGEFSIKKWVSDPQDRRTVFLTNYSEISDTIRPVLSLLIELAGKRVLSLADDRQRRFFFFIDEFGTLNNLPTIPVMLTNGRSKGMSVWIALQDMGQIDKIYGKEISQTIINS